MWIDVPLDNGQDSWGIEQGRDMIHVCTIDEMTNEEIGFCVRALRPVAEKITPYLQQGLHFPTIQHFQLFYRAEQEVRELREQQRRNHTQIRRELAAMYEQVYPFLVERDGLFCQRCHATTSLEIDHIIPVSKGGSNTGKNLQLLCKSCNVKKGEKG